MKVFIKNGSAFSFPILYVLKIIEKNRNVKFDILSTPEGADLIWDTNNELSQPISLGFYKNLQEDKSSAKEGLKEGSQICTENGEIDPIATIFYMINCIQEINPKDTDLDNFGRYKYTSSYQHVYGSIEKNLVEELIDAFCEKHRLVGEKNNSTIFISHDIDSIYGSFLQDGFWALKNMKIGVVFKLMLWELSRKPNWKNIDRIVKLNSEYDIRSTFFWLVNKGKGLQGIKNADYKIESERKLLKLVSESGNTNGLHKSSSSMTIDEEILKGEIPSNYNRYHFLNFRTDRDWPKISSSKLSFDCSLGFAEHYGFRNSYGKAFQPFNVDTNELHDFVEAPLTFMDGTFDKYMKLPSDNVGDIIIDMFDKHPQNCDFSLLWHNTYFTKYKYGGFLEQYKKVAAFIYENKIECLDPKDLIERNKLEW